MESGRSAAPPRIGKTQMNACPVKIDASNAALVLAVMEGEIMSLKIKLACAHRAYDSAAVSKLCDDLAEKKAWAAEAKSIVNAK